MNTGTINNTTNNPDGMRKLSKSHATTNEILNSMDSRKEDRPEVFRQSSNSTFADGFSSKLSSKKKEETKITVHVVDMRIRQDYLLKLCQGLMTFGAPTHRLEEYLRMSAGVLEVDGSFLYVPGCMIISFDDITNNKNEVKLVKSNQGVNLGLLADVHEIYKEVTHDRVGVDEACLRLDKINGGTTVYNAWTITLFYGFASLFVSPWAFQGRYIDMPVCFLLGSIVGFLQHIVAPKCDLYSNLFEIVATMVTSFLARAIGSIQGGSVFCFSALAQAALALMLPGYIVLSGALELQSKAVVPGAVRMVHGTIFSFFLGFGISIGTTLYGLLDANATTATTCSAVLSNPERWIFVPFFTMFAGLANHARLDQLPAMMFIGFSGYIVNFLTVQRFPSSAQISNTLGALTVGLLGNIYSRLQLGIAAVVMLPPILVLVPSGIAASGSLLAGLHSADKIMAGNATINGTSIVPVNSPEDLSKIIFHVAHTMIEIAIGLTVGLFMSTLIAYPLGKKRSGLFTF